jgi:hypothetical protein
MARKQVANYALFKNANGTADINVYYTVGGADTISNLSTAEANYITDILRNEKPVDYDAAIKRFMSGAAEPVGEGEGGVLAPAFTLENWLSKRLAIRNAINWEKTDGSIINYATWSAADKTALANMYMTILGNNSPNLAAAPSLVINPAAADSAATTLSPANAWQYFIAYVAQSLVMEGDIRLPWSVSGYSAEELDLLFDSRNLFSWNSGSNTYIVPFDKGACTPGDPYRIYTFLKNNSLISTSRLTTLYKIIDWCRTNLIHFSGGWESPNVFEQWQYKGLPPAEYVIAGTHLASNPAGPLQHRTGGCWGTTGFLRILLRTLNIPTKLETRGGHALPHFFLGADYYLSHGDDPYNALFRTAPDAPASKLLIDQAKFTAWFGPAVPDPLHNVGRQTMELAVEYLPAYLLRRYCNDQTNGKTHANGEVFDTLKTIFTVAQLEAQTLWTRMDTRIAAIGGCALVPWN